MTHARLERPKIHIGLERATTYARFDAPTTRDEATTHGEDGENTGHTAWSSSLRWPMMVVARGGAYDSGFGHGSLVMVFISTMGFGFEDKRAKEEREGRKRK
ncbi:hypothetical protein ACB092_07G116000 [Castanea dentata]